MWLIRTFLCVILLVSLAACHTRSPSTPADSNASICQILKQKIGSEDYDSTDPATMKRKNAADQAKLLKEYDAYSCPEIIDAAPSP